MKGKRGRYSCGGMAGGTRDSVMQEAHGRKKGGRVKAEMKAEGGKSRLRLDRPGRKRGGRVGADLAPLSSAAKSTEPSDQEDDRGAYASGGRAKNWIKGAIKHPGALHKSLGVPEGERIPAKKLDKAAHSDNPKLARRARLAETLKGLGK
jgi:hypothetical protein